MLRGDARDNRLTGGAGSDLLDGGDGRDTVVYHDAPGGVRVDFVAYLATGHGVDALIDIESAVGSRFSDELRGDAKDNWLTGREGDDLMDGREGADVANFAYAAQGVTVVLEADEAVPGAGWAKGEGRDTLLALEGPWARPTHDRLLGGRGADWLAGGAGDDLLLGRGGDDRLHGGEGDDTLAGGIGDDRLEGGAGADRFVLAPGDGADLVLGFDPGADRVDLSAWGGALGPDALARLTDQAGGCVLDLADGDSLTFAGLAAARLGAGDFILA